MAYAHRCSNCNTNWPYLTEYQSCPMCETNTWPLSDAQHCDILTHPEARQLIAKHRDEMSKRESTEREMDRAFDAWFLRENGIAPWDEPAKRGDTQAPLSEFLPL